MHANYFLFLNIYYHIENNFNLCVQKITSLPYANHVFTDLLLGNYLSLIKYLLNRRLEVETFVTVHSPHVSSSLSSCLPITPNVLVW